MRGRVECSQMRENHCLRHFTYSARHDRHRRIGVEIARSSGVTIRERVAQNHRAQALLAKAEYGIKSCRQRRLGSAQYLHSIRPPHHISSPLAALGGDNTPAKLSIAAQRERRRVGMTVAEWRLLGVTKSSSGKRRSIAATSNIMEFSRRARLGIILEYRWKPLDNSSRAK